MIYLITMGVIVLLYAYPARWLWHALIWASVATLIFAGLRLSFISKVAIGIHLDDVANGKVELWGGAGETPRHSGLYHGIKTRQESLDYVYCASAALAMLAFGAKQMLPQPKPTETVARETTDAEQDVDPDA